MARMEEHEHQMLEQPAGKTVNEIVRGEAVDVVERIFREELRPVVREAIDEEVLRAIKGMVGLTPAAITALADDLGSDDKVIRQRAYSLIVKYVLGNPAVTPTREEGKPPFQVNFQLPRGTEVSTSADTEAVSTYDDETRPCIVCGQQRREDEYTAGAPTCNVCMAKRRAMVEAAMGPAIPGDPGVARYPEAHAVREPSSAEEVLRHSEPAQVPTGVQRGHAEGGQAAGTRAPIRQEPGTPRLDTWSVGDNKP